MVSGSGIFLVILPVMVLCIAILVHQAEHSISTHITFKR